MNDKWKRQAAVIQRGEQKLSDIVYGRLTPQQKDMTEWHFDHPTPYYSTSMKGDPYGNHKGKRDI